MKKLLLTLSLLMAAWTVQAADLLYGLYQGSGNVTAKGTKKVENYDVAIHLADPFLVGKEIRGLRIPINTAAQNTTGYVAWLSSALTLDGNKKNVPDIRSVSFTPSGSWTDVTFDEPYVITAEGLYVGYSFEVSSIGTSASDANQTPLMCFDGGDGLYIHTSRTYRKWQTTASLGTSAILLRLGGEGIHERAASLQLPDDLAAYAPIGKQTSVALTVISHGTEPIKNINYTLVMDGDTIKRRVTTSFGTAYYGQRKTINVTIPAVKTPGTRAITFCITTVNGTDNEDEQPSISFEMPFLSELPKHKPLMEEYTGAWCQYCPLGTAAMEAMTKLHPDDFVGIAYHIGDAMAVITSTPANPSGYPAAYLDRVLAVSPYYGTGSTSLGIENDWKARQAIMAPASLALEATWTSGTTIDVTATATFIRNFPISPYRLTYVLVADDLYGKGRYWSQQNALSGNSSYSGDPYLAPWVALPGVVTNLHFNDVAIQTSCYGDAALDSSLPTSINENTPYSHTYTFDVSGNKFTKTCLDNSAQEPIDNRANIRVVAILIDTRTGEAVNAEKANISGLEDVITGIETIHNSSQSSGAGGTQFIIHNGDAVYDLSGRRVDNSQLPKGIYINNGKKIIIPNP